ncbi:hypothetical protein ANN_17409 [Periplaneta americana]|uniref:Uncharacterized protein n=1 Tax=Periplaneta americana TaxID=6978 RepID=A0ABQ8SUA0_PERAM|nr:hypothetical protein ANN_17409 [Periplaneta americana]
MTIIEPSSNFVPISLQRDVIVVHRSCEIRNTVSAKDSGIRFLLASGTAEIKLNSNANLLGTWPIGTRKEVDNESDDNVLPDNSNAKENRPSGLLQIRDYPSSVTDVDDPEEFVSATYSTSLHSSEKVKEKNLQAFHGNLTEQRKRSSKPQKGILENYDLGTEDRLRIKTCGFHSYEKTW